METETSNFVKFFIYKFFEQFLKNITNVTSRKVRAIEQSHMDAKFATTKFASTELQRWEFEIF